MEKNLGVLQPELKPSDWIAGEETGIAFEEINPSGNWENYLPSKENQFITSFDSSACVTFSALNCIEIQLNFLYPNLTVDQKKKLQDWGYVENGKFNFSDRFTATMSGTTPQGNSLQKVWDSIRKNGLVPEKMWPSVGKSWVEYYSEIPQQIKDFGKNVLTVFNFRYDWIITGICGKPNINYIKIQLKQAPLQPAHPLCGRENGIMKMCPSGVCAAQHATTIYNIDTLIRDFDHYEPYFNNYPLEYPFPWIMRGVVILKKDQQVPPTFSHIFNIDMNYRERSEEVRFLQKGLNILGYKIPETGYYGEITKTSVKDFQSKYKVASIPVLIWNGGRYVGPATRTKLNELLK